MSAINPASFASPTLGIQAPSGIGPGAVGVGRASAGERRQNPQGQEQQPPQTFGRGYRPTFAQPFGGDRNVPPASAYPPNNYAYGGGAFGNARASAPYAPSLSPGAEAFSAGFGQQGDFQSLRQRYPVAQNLPSPAPQSTGVSPISPQNDWTTAFQSLSLNTH